MSVLKPVFLEADGWLSELPGGSIVNIGGTDNTTFTVGGRGLLFDDGSSTAPGGSGVTLQAAYNNSVNVLNEAKIKLQTGRDFLIADDSDDNIFFRIDAETGKVTITGDVEILGASSIINTVVQDSDHWLISPRLGTTVALKVEPDLGVTPIVDLVNMRLTYGGAPVFRIDASGNVHFSGNINIAATKTVDGIDISEFYSNFISHLTAVSGFRHTAADINITPIPAIPTATNVQEALVGLNTKIDNISTLSGVQGYEHIQASASASWVIVHNGNTFRTNISIYDDTWEQVLPNGVKGIDNNTTLVTFASPQSGRAIVILF